MPGEYSENTRASRATTFGAYIEEYGLRTRRFAVNITNRCELLPFLANGSLTQEERGQMQRHVESCDSCQDELRILQRVGQDVARESITPLPARSGRERFAEKLNHRSPPLTRPAMWVAAASIAALVLIVSFRGLEPDPVFFETATEPSSNASMDYVFTLALDSNLAETERQQLWRDLETQSVASVDDGRRYRVVIRIAPKSMADVEAYRQSLLEQPEILSASVVAVELPVTPQD